jgi:SAM-dependent methyltransferase
VCQSQDIEKFAHGRDFEYLSSAKDYNILRCKDCGLLFLDPRPAKDEIPKLYSSSYYTVNPDSPLFLKGFIYHAKLKNDINRVVKIIKRYHLSSVLELGCGNVKRLIGLRKRFKSDRLKLVGIDLQFSKEVRDEAGYYDVELFERNADFSKDDLGLGKFDLVLMSQLLEHLDTPNDVLMKIKTQMYSGVKILIETPNPGGLDFFLFHNRFWGGYHIPRHFYIFPQRSLILFLEKLGFNIIEKGFMPSPGFWIMSFRNALRLNSLKRSDSKWEFLSFHNIFVVSFFVLFDLTCRLFFLPTSNQFILAEERHGKT